MERKWSGRNESVSEKEEGGKKIRSKSPEGWTEGKSEMVRKGNWKVKDWGERERERKMKLSVMIEDEGGNMKVCNLKTF